VKKSRIIHFLTGHQRRKSSGFISYSVVDSMKKFIIVLFFGLYSTGTVQAQLDNGTAGELLWNLYEHVLVISGDGEMPDFTGSYPAPWSDYKDIIEHVIIEEGVTKIGVLAFYECKRIFSVQIASTVTSISDLAFAFCEGLYDITLPLSVTDIGGMAFFLCSSLTSIHIPASVESIGALAFGDCSNLTAIINTSIVPQYIPENIYSGRPANECTLWVPSVSFDLYKEAAGWKDFTIQPFDTELVINKEEIYLFSGATETLTATIAGLGTLVEWESSHPAVATVNPAGTVTAVSPGITIITASIGALEATCMVTVTGNGGNVGTITWEIVDNVLFIRGEGAIPDIFFDNLTLPWHEWKTTITDIDIDEGITSIGNYAFNGFSGISSIAFPTTVTRIGASAFQLCKNLSNVNIPTWITYIGDGAFAGCDLMTVIGVDPSHQVFTSYDGILFDIDMKTLLAFPSGKSGDCVIPESVETIGDCAFLYSRKLTSFTIPATVVRINNYAFESSSLTSITIPASVKNIGVAFMACINLSEIISFIEEPYVINGQTFDGIPPDCILRVPAAAIDDYRNTDGWKHFTNIVPMDDTSINITFDKKEIYLLTGATTSVQVIVSGDLTDFDFMLWDNSAPDVAMTHYVCVTDNIDNGSGSQMLHACTVTIAAIKQGSTAITVSAFENEATCTVTVIQPGTSTIEGIVANTGTENVRVNLYIKVNNSSQTKRGIVGGYVLLATTVPNGNGEYGFENLPEGSYQVEVVMEDYEPEATDEITLSDEETFSDINFTIDPEKGIILVDAGIPTGMEDNFVPDLKVYPNPFTDVLHIMCAAAVETWHAASLQVINTAGAVVHTQTITHPDETIHLGHLPAGMYIIRLENGGIVKTTKIIKIQ